MRRIVQASVRVRFAFWIQPVMSNARFRSRKRIENCDVRHNAGQRLAGRLVRSIWCAFCGCRINDEEDTTDGTAQDFLRLASKQCVQSGVPHG